MDGECGVVGMEPSLLNTGGIGSERSINGSRRSLERPHFVHVTLVKQIPPKSSVTLSGLLLSSLSTGIGFTFGVCGEASACPLARSSFIACSS